MTASTTTAEVFERLSLEGSALPPSSKIEHTSEALGRFSSHDVKGVDHGPMFEYRLEVAAMIFEALRELESETGELTPRLTHLFREVAAVMFEDLRKLESETGELTPRLTHLLREVAAVTLRAETMKIFADEEVATVLKNKNLGPEEKGEALNRVLNQKMRSEMEADRAETKRLNDQIKSGLAALGTVEEEP